MSMNEDKVLYGLEDELGFWAAWSVGGAGGVGHGEPEEVICG